MTTYVLRPSHVSDDREAPIFLELHGGALIMGGGDLAWMMAAGKAADRHGSTWVPDYRMAPLHPYPAALDDCLTVYRHALAVRPPSKIIVSGVSAGATDVTEPAMPIGVFRSAEAPHRQIRTSSSDLRSMAGTVASAAG